MECLVLKSIMHIFMCGCEFEYMGALGHMGRTRKAGLKLHFNGCLAILSNYNAHCVLPGITTATTPSLSPIRATQTKSINRN